MSKKYTYFFGAGYTSLSGQMTTTPGGIGTQSEITSLYDNGVFHIAFGDISGAQYINFGVPAGDSSNPADPDILLLDSGSLQNILIWDEFTTTNGIGGSAHNLYGATHNLPASAADGRYGLPGGGTDQVAAIDVIMMGQGAEYNLSTNLINLGYNASVLDGVGDPANPYNTAVTVYGGPGRELVIAGEGNDVVYGGNDHTGVGEGIWGGGGADTIYAGANTGQTVDPNGSPNTGADDLYGYSGNDIMYGANDGDVYYGDIGSDNIYGAGFAGTGTIGSGYNGDKVTFFGGDGNDTLYASANVGSNGVTQTREFFIGGDPQNNWVDKNFVQNADGNDTGTMDVVSYQNAPTAITVNIAAGGTYSIDIHGQAIPNNSQVGVGSGGATGDIFFGIEGIIGGTQGDTLIGSSDGTLINGTTIYGGNFFSGLGGNDTLFGAGASDTLWGGLGVDTLFGGDANDILDGNGGGDSVFGEAGNDTIAYANDIPIDGVGDSLVFNYTAGTTTLALGAGTTASDRLDGGTETDSLNLTASNDFLVVNSDDLLTNGVAGANVPGKIAAFEFVDGGAGNDIIALNDAGGSAYNQNVTVAGGTGNDLIAAGAGADVIFGGVFGDTTSATTGLDTLYGGAANDTLYGGADADFLSGGTGADLNFGDAGNDIIQGDQDQVLAGGSTSNAWDGDVGSAAIVLAMGGKGHTQDTIDGGAGTDTYNFFTNGSGGGATGASALGFAGTTQRIFGIELIVGSAAADVVNLTFNDNVSTRLAYTGDVSITVGDGSDIAFSGSGNDLIVGDATTGGADSLFGGAGNDLIWGDLQNDITGLTGLGDRISGGLGNDSVFGAAGDDTLYGGGGNDTVDGGAGNDTIVDSDALSIMGGDGADIINIDFTNVALAATINGGLNNTAGGSDGADRVFTTGSYASVTSSLGLGNDVFIGSSSGTGANVDTVDGQEGNDVLSSWAGNDVLIGNNGNDVAWGGAGNDTIYGGAGTDYLYGGGTSGGGTNVMYGGAGEDYYYVSRADGINQIWDQDRIANADTDPTVNYLVIFGQFDFADTTGSGGQPIDYLLNGAGVFETDLSLGNNSASSMVRITNVGDVITLSVINGLGAGTTTVTFDDRDISQIVLWNNDATTGTNVLQFYGVDLATHTYNFIA